MEKTETRTGWVGFECGLAGLDTGLGIHMFFQSGTGFGNTRPISTATSGTNDAKRQGLTMQHIENFRDFLRKKTYYFQNYFVPNEFTKMVLPVSCKQHRQSPDNDLLQIQSLINFFPDRFISILDQTQHSRCNARVPSLVYTIYIISFIIFIY